MTKTLKADVYQPEPWERREVCFRKGATVKVIPADNLPDDSEIKYWIDESDPRYPDMEYSNPYGFALFDGLHV